jgi:Fe-S cluster assembly protein SufB
MAGTDEDRRSRKAWTRRPSMPSRGRSGYKYGWETDIEMEYAPKGLNEDIVR